jgi:hypothetical protein
VTGIPSTTRRRLAHRFAALLGLVLAGCLFATLPARAAELPIVAPAMECGQLLGVDFNDTEGAPFRLDTAAVVPAGAGVGQAYCRVTGNIAAQVHFEVHLPVAGWTQRFAMSGCGGYCGAVSVPAQLAEGFGCMRFESGEMVVASHDAGHVRKTSAATPNTPGPFADGLWAAGNPDALVDFAYMGVHKATLATKALINAYYGRAPKFSYYIGCSDGGRQGLQEAQRFPKDYNGIIGGSNTNDVTETNTYYHGWNVRKNAAGVVPGSHPSQYLPILTADKLPALHAAVLAACGNMGGGLKDMIQDPRACQFDARSLICAGADGPDCLSPAQADAVNAIWQGPVDETGAHLTAGDMPYGSEAGWVGSMVTAPGVPLNLQTSGDYQFSWDWPHYMASFGAPLDIDVRTLQFTRAEFNKLTRLSQLFAATNPDLRPFAAAGGKLLLWHGWTDTGSTPNHTLNYYDAVRRSMGEAEAAKVMALYMIPGVYHCNGGPQATREDFLTQLMDWVEDGTPPGQVEVRYYASNTIASPVALERPVWPYPAIATYAGSGDPKQSGSFVKTARPPALTFPDRFEWVGLANYAPGKQLWCRTQGAGMECGTR